MKNSRALGLILLLGFALRVWGIGFGLPDLYHADEPALVLHALAHGTGDLNPHYFKLPALLNYYLCAWFGVYFLVGRLVGWFPSPEVFMNHFLEDPSTIYLLGRMASGLLLGVLGIYLLYRLALRVTSHQRALLASFLLSICFLHVRDSHYVIYDIPLTTALTGCFIILSQLVEEGKRSQYIAFGILTGLTTALKYNGALVVIPFLLAHFFRYRGRKISYVCVAALFAFLAYALGNPFSLIDFKTFWQEFSVQAGSEGSVGFLHHVRYSLKEGMGLSLLSAGGGGIFFFALSRSRAKKLIAFFVMLWLVYLGSFSQPYERYALPVIPFLCLGAVEFIGGVLERTKINPRAGWAVAVLALSAVPSTKSVYVDYLFSEKDVRTVAREWIEENIPKGSKMAVDYPFQEPRLRFSYEQLREKQKFIQGAHSEIQQKRLDLLLKNRDPKQASYTLYFLDDGDPQKRPLFSRPTLSFDVESLKQAGVQSLLIARLTPAYEYPAFYERVREEFKLIQRFSPYRDSSIAYSLATVRQTAASTESLDLFKRQRLGDVIEIYQIPS